MSKSNRDFNYGQKWKQRIITDPKLLRFLWNFHGVTVTYSEPYTAANLTNENTQSFIANQTMKPVRTFELDMVGLKHCEEHPSGLADELNFSKLYAFYEHHGLHKRFIYEHPVYGDVVVRFAKTLSIPKKTPDGLGTIGSFNLTLVEVVTTHYNFDPTEEFEGNFPFPAGFYDVEVDVVEDTKAAPLGGNYEMVFKRSKKPLKTFKLTCSGLRYFESQGQLNLSINKEQNMLTLEAFYLKYRLSKAFTFHYLGEDYLVRFKQPIVIPKLYGNRGVFDSTELIFVEAPYEVLDEKSLQEISMEDLEWLRLNFEYIEPLKYKINYIKQGLTTTLDSFIIENINLSRVVEFLKDYSNHTTIGAYLENKFGSYESHLLIETNGSLKYLITFMNTEPQVEQDLDALGNDILADATLGLTPARNLIDSIVTNLSLNETNLLQLEVNKQVRD